MYRERFLTEWGVLLRAGLLALGLLLAGAVVMPVWAQSEGANEVALYSGVSGRIAVVHVSAGDQVSQGDVLVEMDTTPLQAKLDAARARLTYAQNKHQLAKDHYARQDELYQEGSLSTVELKTEELSIKEAAAELAEARAAAKIAQWQIEQAQLIAPVSGKVVMAAFPGQHVNAEVSAVPLIRLQAQ